MRRKSRIKWFDAVNYAFMAFIILIMLYPLYYVLIVSISNATEVAKGKVHLWPSGVSFAAYRHLMKYEAFMNSFKNSVIYTVSGTLINLVMTAMCAYPLSRDRFIFRRGFSLIIVFTMYFSGGLIPNYLLINDLGMIDTIWALLLPGAISTYNMLIMRTFFVGIPGSLHEAAEIDGAGEWRKLVSVVLPLSVPIIATMVLFYAVGHWNSWFNAVIYMNTNEKYPLQVFVRSIVILQNTNQTVYSSSSMETDSAVSMTIQYAAIIIATVPILIIYPVLQKYFVKGVMIGSIKG